MSATPELLVVQLADPAHRQRLISAYLRGQLAPPLRAEFEIRLIADAELLADVEAEEALRQHARESLVPVPDPMPDAPRAMGGRRWPMATAAASFVFGIAATLGAVTLVDRAAHAPMLTAAEIAVISDLRSGAATASTPLALLAERVVVQIPAPNVPGPYRVRWLSADGREVAALAFERPDEAGYLNVAIDGRARDGQAGTLVVEARAGDGWRIAREQPVSFDRDR